MGVRVVKLGGSLLDLPDLVPRFRRWLKSNPPGKTMIVVGGGQIVDVVRGLDRIHRLDAGFAHWLCVDLLAKTAEVAAKLFPEFGVISRADHLREFVHAPDNPGTHIVQVSAFYNREPTNMTLPESWDTTTDSIAALLALDVQAEELVLLKSRGPESARTELTAWAEAGLVDPYFPHVAAGIPVVSIYNLREECFP